MKLNPDLIRSILITVEEETGLNQSFWYNSYAPESKKWEDFKYLEGYNYEEVVYHLQQCNDAGYFSPRTISSNRSLTIWPWGFMVADLSPRGHEFVNNIREDMNWGTVKSNLSKIGSFALSMIENVAASVISNQINGRL